VAANGFKHLFKQNEVNGVVDKLYQNGWITDDEYKAYNSKANKKRLTDLSKKIEDQRKKDNSKSKKQTKKKRTK
jgi:membrane peptidoglycan carboxypeptidase